LQRLGEGVQGRAAPAFRRGVRNLIRSERGKNRQAVRADAQTETALLEILESFCSGFAARDADGVLRLFAPDAEL
jgi:hypothetical protein